MIKIFRDTDDLSLLREKIDEEAEEAFLVAILDAIFTFGIPDDLELINLIDELQDEDTDIQGALIKGIGSFREISALNKLRSLNIKDAEVREAIGKAEARIQRLRQRIRVQESSEVQTLDELRYLLQMIHGYDNVEIRASVLEAIAGFNTSDPEVCTQLRGIILNKSENVEVRKSAAQALVNIQNLEELVWFRDLARYEDDDLRDIALTAISRYNHLETLAGLEELIQDSCPDVRHAAVRAIASIQNPDNLERLRTMVQNEDESIRAIACAAIANFQMPDDLFLFRGLANDESQEVCQAALAGAFGDSYAARSRS